MVVQPAPASSGDRLLQAVALHQQGLLAEAQSLYRDILAGDAQHFDCLHLLGVIAAQMRRFQDAVALIGKALAVNPDAAAAHYNRGMALRELRRGEAAVAAFDHAIAASPGYAEAHHSRAAALHEQGRRDLALAGYDRALALRPDFVDALLARAHALKELGREGEALDGYARVLVLMPAHGDAHYNRAVALQISARAAEAVAAYDRVLALAPGHAVAHFNRGAALQDLGRLAAALAGCHRALALAPDFPEAHYNRANLLHRLTRAADAVASYDRALAARPHYAHALANRGNALEDLGRGEAALASQARAVALEPGYAEARYNHANALRALGRAEAALAGYDRALALRPDYAEASYNLGLTLHELKRLPAAVASYDRAIAARPDYAEAHLNKALSLLAAGDFGPGFQLYEWRWALPPLSSAKRRYPQPLWLGGEPLAGKTLLLHAEQGLGDTIQFCRYAALAAARGARVILEVPPALTTLLAELEGVAELVARGAPLPAFDCHCPLMSLPLAFGTTLATIPGRGPYLRADPARVAAWAGRLGPKTGLRVGLAWSGSAVHRNDRNRSLDLASLLGRLPAGATYVSLQKDVTAADRATLEAHPQVRHFAADFAETAALCALMDVVVSVDTSIAHLGGALGRPTWLLLSHAHDWRWLADRDDSPWYPAMRLYRQGADRDWGPVLERVRGDLAGRAFAPAPPAGSPR